LHDARAVAHVQKKQIAEIAPRATQPITSGIAPVVLGGANSPSNVCASNFQKNPARFLPL